jgi:hypothetical protein
MFVSPFHHYPCAPPLPNEARLRCRATEETSCHRGPPPSCHPWTTWQHAPGAVAVADVGGREHMALLAVRRHAAPRRRGSPVHRGPLPCQSADEREREWMCEREGDKCRHVVEDFLYAVCCRRGSPLHRRLPMPPRKLQKRERERDSLL